MTSTKTARATANASRTGAFASSWFMAGSRCRAVCRRLYAILRMSCRVLGMKSPRGVGLLGIAGAVAVVGVFGATPAMAQQQGIYINGGASNSCTHVRADLTAQGRTDEVGEIGRLLRVQRNDNCDPSNAATQTNRVLFYGTGASQTASGATSLSLGGLLHVNGGFIGVGPSVPTDAEGNAIAQTNAGVGIAIGNSGTRAPSEGVAIGQAARASTLRAIAIGWNAEAKAGPLGLRASIAIGENAKAEDVGIAMGIGAQQTTRYGIAIGRQTRSTDDSAIAIGANANASSIATVALGLNSSASGRNGTAVGTAANAAGEGALAGGQNARALSRDAVALGRNAFVDEGLIDGLAVGHDARVTHNMGVAIGSASISAGLSTVTPWTLNGTEYRFDSSNAAATVSVGSPFRHRQITNVAPGAITGTSVDAVNGSQLFAAFTEINAMAAKNADLQSAVNELARQMAETGRGGGAESVLAAVGPGSSVDGNGDLVLPEITLDSIGGTTDSEGNVVPATQPTTLLGAIDALDAEIEKTNDAVELIFDNALLHNPLEGVDAFDAKGERITNVADGVVAEGSTDAINGGQLHALSEQIGDAGQQAAAAVAGLGGGAAVAADGTVTQPHYDVATIGPDGAIAPAGSTHNNVGGALDAVGSNVVNLAGVVGEQGSDIAALNQNALLWNEDARAFTALRNGAPQQIANVAAGTSGTDAVNVSQLEALGDEALNAAEAAQNAAETAQATAEGAQTAAATAQGTAEAAQAAADTAQATAENAQTAAATAQGAADAAQTSADTAQETAVSASVAAAAAQDAAGDAQSAADTAQATAEGAQTAATTAQGAAEAAHTAATEADRKGEAALAGLGGGAGLGSDGSAIPPSYSVAAIGPDGTVATGSTHNSVGGALDAVGNNVVNLAGVVGQQGSEIAALNQNALLWNDDARAFTAERDGAPQQIANVAAGTNGTDAVNFSQLQALGEDAADAMSAAQTAQAAADNAQSTGAAAQNAAAAAKDTAAAAQANATQAQATADKALLGADFAIEGLGGGARMSATGYHAPVYSIAAIDADGAIVPVGSSHNTVGGALDAIGDNVVNLAGVVGEHGSEIAVLNQNALLWNEDADAFTAERDGAPQQIANVAAGVADTDAVNVAQLREAAGAAAAQLEGIGEGETVAGRLVDAARATADALGGNATANPDGTVTAPDYSVAAIGPDGAVTAGSTHNNVGGALDAIGDNVGAVNQRVTDLAATAETLQDDALLWDDTAGAYSAAHGDQATSRITNVASAINGDDAVNLDQLDAVRGEAIEGINLANQGINIGNFALTEAAEAKTVGEEAHMAALRADALAAESGLLSEIAIDAAHFADAKAVAALAGLGGGAGVADDGFGDGRGAVIPPSYEVATIGANGVIAPGGSTHDNVGSALDAIGDNVVNLAGAVGEQDIAITRLNQNALLWNDDAQAFTAARDGAPQQIANVAAGTNSTDAVNLGQLADVRDNVDTLRQTTGRELTAANDGIARLEQAGAMAVTYAPAPDGGRSNTIGLVGGDPNAPVLIANIARGSADNDAVNVQHLNESQANTAAQAEAYTDRVAAQTLSSANHYTDTAVSQVSGATGALAEQVRDGFGQLASDISAVSIEAKQAAAIGLAASSLRFNDTPGKLSLAAGGGFWQGEGALAVGLGYTSDNGDVRMNLTGVTSGGHIGVGGGFSVTLN